MHLVESLRDKVSKGTPILTKDDNEFTDAHVRWTNIDRKTPAVIVQPLSEDDVVAVVRNLRPCLYKVKVACAANVPFVPASGGHSEWSTVEDGIIIDLSKYKQVSVDADQRTVTVRGGVLMKELQIALSEQGQFTAIANGNTVGVIPYVIGGGISSYSPIVGYACENLLSATLVTSTGTLTTCSSSQNPALLWALRGAGQFFGITTSITLRIYPLSLIHPSPPGIRQIGVVFFPPPRAAEVCQTLKNIVGDSPGENPDKHISSGHFMSMHNPDFGGQVLMVAPQYFGTGPELQKTFQPIIDLEPLHHQHGPSNFEEHSDHLGWMCPKGEYKRFSQTGLVGINPANFARLVDLHRELLETIPGTERSVFTIEWHTSTPKTGARETETAFGMKGVEIWLNILTWYTDPGYHAQVLQFDNRAQEIMRADTREDAYIAYTNTSRNDPVEWRYKDPKAVEKLRALKREWDPDGCFTKEFL
ncbi:uncharacterized protein KY384_000321 [Bacidia gigantensis]|uniref:uncharacterized protein n=1 Tax=Bacidia gigantensis TaxID=2732470 RepID=UPI001D04D951|nr:uncharacterized protein KY384_000321 [Bacidia gigantensis]KAG8526328.1 hypothetical protein KY384_000321 [Bacidia gigantensis]